MTIRELARKLRLSKTTVSLALRDSYLVKKSTRERIKKRANELGYTMNPVASAFLQQVRSKGVLRYRANLALLTEPYWPSPTMEELFQGMSRRARELGYTVDIVNPQKHDAPSLTRILMARGVLGVLVGPVFDNVPQPRLEWEKFAAIAFGYSMERPGLHRVVPHHAQCLRTAFAQCRAKGFRRIGLVLRQIGDARSNHLWSSCFLGLQMSLPASERVEPIVLHDSAYTAANLRKWLRREKPDAVIFHYQRMILNVAEIFEGRFAKVYTAVLDRLPTDSFPGVDQQFGRCGAQMADLLSLQILHNERGIPAHPTITMVDGVWVDESRPFPAGA